MAVNIQASAQGSGGLGGALNLGQLGGSQSPAVFSAGLFVILLVVVVLIAMSLR